MNKLSIKDRTQIVSLLIEGSSINASYRFTGTSKNTVLKLLAEVGEACALYQDHVMRGLTSQRIECDAIWSFVGAKQENMTKGYPDGYGDCYTFTAIDPDTKLMPCAQPRMHV